MTNGTITEHKEETPRLDPIEHPSGIKMKLAYWLTKRKIGKVITPLKVAYARFPESLPLAWALVGMEDKFTIDPELQFLIQTYTASVNGCAFCIDIARANLQKEQTESKKLDELLKFEKSDRFTEAEKAALAYSAEATENTHVTDDTFERLQKHFSEEEIVHITIINAIENFYNLINAPLNIGSDELCELWSQSK